MKVEIGAKTAARTIKVLLRALEIAEDQLKLQVKEINRLQADNEHMARESKDLRDQVASERSTRQEYGVILKELQPQMFSIEDDATPLVESAPVAQSPSKPCPGCGATPWGQRADCPTCLIARCGL